MRSPLRRKTLSRLVSLALAVPGALMLADWLSGRVLAMDMLHPSGEMSVRLMVLAMLPGPLAEVAGSRGLVGRLLRGWLTVRRNLGVGAFGYALLHFVFYAADMTPSGMLAELPIPSILTGWLALLVMAVPAAISFDAAVRALRRRWQTLQYLVYPAALLSAAHWLLLAWHWQPVLFHFAPLLAVWALRAIKRRNIARHQGSLA